MRASLLFALLFAAWWVCGATYYIDPVSGSDDNAGTAEAPWLTLNAIDAITLGAGDVVYITQPGTLTGSLRPVVSGATAENPARIVFAEGTYTWTKDDLDTTTMQISNTNDQPNGLKSVAMWIENVENLVIEGAGDPETLFLMTGKTVMIYLHESDGITFRKFGLDYVRPTVTEYTVEEVASSYAIMRIHKDYTFSYSGTTITWDYGDSTTTDTSRFVLTYNPTEDYLVNSGGKAINASATSLETLDADGDYNRLKVYYSSNPGFVEGYTYTHRIVTRDCAGVFSEESSNITYEDMGFHFIHGMGVVSQFTENITFRNVEIAPRENSGRIIATWADMLHFSGCKGQILIDNVHFSGSNDDAINVHGTHLQLTSGSGNEAVVTFKHSQTYGFKAFHAGDEVAFVKPSTLVPYATRTVATAELSTTKTMTLTFTEDLPDGITYGTDVLENVTWNPDITVRNSLVEHDSVRGFLFTTRGKVIVDNVTFLRTAQYGLQMADDAATWYESGPVRDLTVQNCTFDGCNVQGTGGGYAIMFNSENTSNGGPVHSGVKFFNNTFLNPVSTIFRFWCVDDILIAGNTVDGDSTASAATYVNTSSSSTNLLRVGKDALIVSVKDVTYADTTASQTIRAALLEGSLKDTGATSVTSNLTISNDSTFVTPASGSGLTLVASGSNTLAADDLADHTLYIPLESVTLTAGTTYTLIFGDASNTGTLHWMEFTATPAQVASAAEGTLFLPVASADFASASFTTPQTPWSIPAKVRLTFE